MAIKPASTERHEMSDDEWCAAAQRIIEITGARKACPPDPRKLGAELSGVARTFQMWRHLDAGQTNLQGASKIQGFRAALRKLEPLATAIEAEPIMKAALVRAAVDMQSHDERLTLKAEEQVSSALSGIRFLAGLFAQKGSLQSSSGAWQTIDGPSAITWLLGEKLPEVFEGNFLAADGAPLRFSPSRNSHGDASSPGARFVLAVVREFGLPDYSADGVRRARQRAIKPQSRASREGGQAGQK